MLTRKILTRRLLPATAAVVMSVTFSAAFAADPNTNQAAGLKINSAAGLKLNPAELKKKGVQAKMVEGTLPDYYPSMFSNTGVVQHIDGLGKSIIISGTRYHLYNKTQVHTLFKEQGSTYNIGKNDHVGFSYTENGEKKRFLDEIWVLPRGSAKGH